MAVMAEPHPPRAPRAQRGGRRAQTERQDLSVDEQRRAILHALQEGMRRKRKSRGHTIQDPKHVFAAFDRDGTGRLPVGELHQALMRLGLRIHVERLSPLLDVDEDEIEYGELLGILRRAALSLHLSGDERRERERRAVLQALQQAMRARRQVFGNTFQNPKELFAAFDQNHSGTLSPDDLYLALKRLGLGVSEEQLARLQALVDVDRNGEIDYAELLEYLEGKDSNQSPPAQPPEIEWGSVAPPSSALPQLGGGRRKRGETELHDKPWVQERPEENKGLGRPPSDVLKLLGNNIKYLREELKQARRKEARREADHAAELKQKDEELREQERGHQEEVQEQEQRHQEELQEQDQRHQEQLRVFEEETAVMRRAAHKIAGTAVGEHNDHASVLRELAAEHARQLSSTMVATAMAAAAETAADEEAGADETVRRRPLNPAVDSAVLALISQPTTPGNNFVTENREVYACNTCIRSSIQLPCPFPFLRAY